MKSPGWLAASALLWAMLLWARASCCAGACATVEGPWLQAALVVSLVLRWGSGAEAALGATAGVERCGVGKSWGLAGLRVNTSSSWHRH